VSDSPEVERIELRLTSAICDIVANEGALDTNPEALRQALANLIRKLGEDLAATAKLEKSGKWHGRSNHSKMTYCGMDPDAKTIQFAPDPADANCKRCLDAFKREVARFQRETRP
jgi:hypothetical protein